MYNIENYNNYDELIELVAGKYNTVAGLFMIGLLKQMKLAEFDLPCSFDKKNNLIFYYEGTTMMKPHWYSFKKSVLPIKLEFNMHIEGLFISFVVNDKIFIFKRYKKFRLKLMNLYMINMIKKHISYIKDGSFKFDNYELKKKLSKYE